VLQQHQHQQLRRKRKSLQKVLLSRTKRQQHQLLSQHQSKSLEVNDCGDDGADEIDGHVAYRRPQVIKELYVYDLDDDSELPTHITERLAQIRALALEKYKEVHG
jgi:hypothetical protein